MPNPNAAAIWGDDGSGHPTLADTNPINDVAALDGTDLYISFGNGEPGPLDPPNKQFDELEAWVGEGDEHFLGALDAAGIPATVDAYGPGHPLVGLLGPRIARLAADADQRHRRARARSATPTKRARRQARLNPAG